MEWNKQNLKGALLVVCGGAAFYAALQHLGVVASALAALVGMLSPFLLGGAIAFVLNVPIRAIERNLYPKAKRGAGLRRPLALVMTLLALDSLPAAEVVSTTPKGMVFSTVALPQKKSQKSPS